MTREELCDIAVSDLVTYRRLICQWATGVGKSSVALNFLRYNPGSTALILVPETDNISNWEKEFDKFGVDRSNVTIKCYASFHKHQDTIWDLLVFDEMPHVDTEKRMSICTSVMGRYILALGAVIDEDEQTSLESVYGKFQKNIVTLEQAIEWGILPKPSVRILHLQMDNEKKRHYFRGKMYTDRERYNIFQNNVDSLKKEYESSPSDALYERILSAGNARKRFLGKMKDDALVRIKTILDMKQKRYLCFCSSIAQANRIGKKYAFTSKTPTSAKLLERFNNGEINSLFVVGKLIEGQNLNNIEVGVLGQLGGKERITVQSIGRIMRSKEPIIYVPVFDGTKDDSYLYYLTLNIPEKYIKHYKF